MKTLIAYASKRGATADMAARIARGLGNAELVDLRSAKASRIDLAKYGAVVIGAPSYMGSWNKVAAKWATAHEAVLASKRLAFFEIGMGADQLSVKVALPSLCERAVAVAKLGGEIRWKRLSFLERMVVKGVMKKEGDTSTIDDAAVDTFIKTLKGALK